MHHVKTRGQGARETGRRGSILLIVLVVIVMLALGAYTFSATMVSEMQAARTHGKDVQTRAFADSGIELAAAMLGSRYEMEDVNFYHNPDAFQGVLLQDSAAAGGRGRFSIVAPVENEPSAVRFGLMDESSKINVNALVSEALGLDEFQAREMLMMLPEMTEDIADAILDYIDKDFELREFGEEGQYYESLNPPYQAKDGPLESLDELLLVRDITPWLLFGEDANRNGLLDPNENDGDASPPYDDADGILNVGWSAFLTVYSREMNRRGDGTDRIDLNQSTLTTLYDDLELEFDADAAKFIVAYRLFGRVLTPEEEAEGESENTGGQLTSRNQEQELQNLANGVAQVIASGGGQEAVTRAGMDLSKGGSNQITSIYDLIDAQVDAEVDGAQEMLDSPWTSQASEMTNYLPVLFDVLTTTNKEYIQGRININQARLEVLLGIPEMTEDLADSIVNSTPIGPDGQPVMDTLNTHATTGWLVMEELVDLPTMRKLDKYLTTRGDVYRVQSLGFFDSGGPTSRLEAVIDATYKPAKIVFLRDLTNLGRGYPRQQLMPVEDGQ